MSANETGPTVREAIDMLKENDSILVKEAALVGEIERKDPMTWTSRDLNQLFTIYHRVIKPVTRGS